MLWVKCLTQDLEREMSFSGQWAGRGSRGSCMVETWLTGGILARKYLIQGV